MTPKPLQILPLVVSLILSLSLSLGSRAQKATPLLEECTSCGLQFTHFNGMSGELFFPEIAGSGAAFLDYDRDGDLDLYLVQGSMLGSKKPLSKATFPPQGQRPPTDRLLRNDLGSKGPHFVDVTAEAGINATGYGIGVTTGDFDGDGWIDLYVTQFGPNLLWRNRGDGTFEELASRAGVEVPSWSIASTFLDFDDDGHLDLFVADYVVYSLEKEIRCYSPTSRRDYCGPGAFPPTSNHLFRNRGDGTFEDVSQKSGIATAQGASLGVIAADFDQDGTTDIFVANDGMDNHLWLNQGKAGFREEALFAGVGVNRKGQAEASMGVDAQDFDGDGDLDLFMTHLAGETNTLYLNLGDGLFEDRTSQWGLGQTSINRTGFGTGWFDLENDGDLNLLVLNGAVRLIEEQAAAHQPYPLAEPNQLYGREKNRFSIIPGISALEQSHVSRGAVLGDVDNDGDTDILITNNSGPARLLLNRAADGQPWWGFKVRESQYGDALGARLEIRRRGAPSLWRWVRVDGSYASAKDPRVLIGGEALILEVVVRWSGGERERFSDPPKNQYTILRKGQGKRVVPQKNKENP